MHKTNKIIIILLTAILLLTALTAGLSIQIVSVGAVVLTENDFDKSSVEDDLGDSDLSQYKKDAHGTPTVIGVIEYCYTENIFKQSNFGLYLYVFNPAQTSWDTDEGASVVNIATEYNKSGEPSSYSNTPITFLSKSSGDYAELFYKFKVTDASKLLTQATAYNQAHGERRYDISGFQLRDTKGNVKDFNVAYTYTYTGYAKGYNSESKDGSTLLCERNELETVTLDLHSTFYRPEGHNSEGIYTRDQLSSVYFAVPNSIKNRYDRLYSVKAEWYRALTDKILVTDNADMYDNLYPFLGRTDGSNAKYGFGSVIGDSRYDLYYNDFRSEILTPMGGKRLDVLNYIFKVTQGKTATDYTVSGEDLKDFILERSADVDNLFLGKYDLSMFSECDTQKIVVDITAEDKYSLTGQTIAEDWWGKLFCQYNSSTYNGIEGIKEVGKKDFLKTPEGATDAKATCDHLYIDYRDYDEFTDFYAESVLQDKTVYLLRFDVTQYNSVPVKLWLKSKDFWGNYYNGKASGNGYVAQIPAYLEFDVISLTYEKAGVYTVIPVVADPIDIFPDITAPPNWTPTPSGCNGLPQWLIIVFIAIGCLLLLPVVIALLPVIIQLGVFLVKCAFTLLCWLVRLLAFLVKWTVIILWQILSAPFRFVLWIAEKIRTRQAMPKATTNGINKRGQTKVKPRTSHGKKR